MGLSEERLRFMERILRVLTNDLEFIYYKNLQF
jgi:hypothetical protein